MYSSASCFHCGLIEVMLMRLSCDQRSKARRTCCSAIEGLLGSVLVRICSQRLRRLFSRCASRPPFSTFLRRSAMLLERSVQRFPSGVRSNLSAAKSATTAAAANINHCWRFLIFIFASFTPMKIERELQRRFGAADLNEPDFGNASTGAQPVERFQQGRIVARRA